MIGRRLVVVAAVAIAALAAVGLARPALQEHLDLAAETREGAAGTRAPYDDPTAAGEYLARAGNCSGCHTRPGGEPYTGGRGIATPFGTIFSGNLTPDPETGLGAWSADEFYRALRHGRSRDGRLLYPAFPYTSYTLISRADADALFAYLRTLAPLNRPQPPPRLRFPYNTKLALVVWRALYFWPRGFEPADGAAPASSRGAYLTEGLGHCGACHTPRGPLGGEQTDALLAGGELEGWDAPPLRRPAALDDTALAELATLLKTGVSADRAVSGPMAEVVFHSLQHLTDEDIDAMARYVASLPTLDTRTGRSGVRVPALLREDLLESGSALYGEHCADCHGDDGRGEPYVYPALAGNSEVLAPSPRNILNTVMFGGFPPSTDGNPRPHGMPPFSHQLEAHEVAAVLTYIRGAWGNTAPAVSPMDITR